MKVLYAIQGTGNGHLSRARDVIPALQKKGLELDILVSGIQADIQIPHPVKYRLQGLSFIFGKQGNVNIWRTYLKSNAARLQKEIKSIPIENYDLVINDFEPVSAWACKLKNKPSVSFSHQAAVLSPNSPKPDKNDLMGKFILKNYAPTTQQFGLHFRAYGERIYTPIIRNDIRTAATREGNHYTVYLPSYSDGRILKILSEVPDIKWEVFSKHNKVEFFGKNISIRPITNEAFVHSMVTAKGVLCGAGFETPAEALYLGKKLMVIPMKGQYEQQCNSAALKELGVPVIKSLKNKHLDKLRKWVDSEERIVVNYPNITEQIIDQLLEEAVLGQAILVIMLNSSDYFDLQANDFGDDFIWGVSTAAYQIEGAYNIHDKGPSIWDDFTSKKGNTYQNQHGNDACEFYHKFQEDILLMKKMNMGHFRFSLSWSRILPKGTGIVSDKGIQFYNDVINFCLQCGITPWVTLYHWDLPLALEEKGGWTNRDIVQWFQEYVTVCAHSFGDRVKNWMVLNEPMVFTGAGYFLGVHAPGRKGLRNFLPSVHHAVLCQAAGGRILRKLVANANIGTTFSCSQISPYRNNRKDLRAAERVDAILNRLFIEPSLGMGYPWDTIPVLKRIQTYILPGDAENSAFDFDFVGIQNYTREKVRHSYLVPYVRAKIVKASKRRVKATLMDWEVYPPSIFRMIERFNSYKGVNKIIITENGAAFADEIEQGGVHDEERLSYLQAYLEQVYRAKREGLKVDGYFVWTFADNFEWAEGYYPRFGLVYVDFNNQQRIIKSSGKWFSHFLGTRQCFWPITALIVKNKKNR